MDTFIDFIVVFLSLLRRPQLAQRRSIRREVAYWSEIDQYIGAWNTPSCISSIRASDESHARHGYDPERRACQAPVHYQGMVIKMAPNVEVQGKCWSATDDMI